MIGAITLAAAWRSLPETHVNRSGVSAAPGMIEGAIRLLSLPQFLAYATTLAFTSSVFFAFLGGAPHVMVDILHRTPVEYGLWFITVSGGYMFGNFLSGRYTQAVGIDRMMLIGCIITMAGGLLCLAAAISGFLTPATLFLPMALAGFGNGLTIPNGTAGAISVDPRITGAAAGWAGFLQMACGAAASQLVGSLQNDWPLAVFWFMAAGSALALARACVEFTPSGCSGSAIGKRDQHPGNHELYGRERRFKGQKLRHRSHPVLGGHRQHQK